MVNNNFGSYLKTIKNENTRIALESLIKKIENYSNQRNMSIYDMEDVDIDMFIKTELRWKSNTTISATISRLKSFFNYINKKDVTDHLSLNYIKSIIETKKNLYLTPSEVKKLLNSLINYQDQALILLCYMGLYNNNFEIIRNLKVDQIDFNKNVINIKEGYSVKMTEYCSSIFKKTIKEDTMEKYIFQEGRRSTEYKLNMESPYLLKSKKRKGGKEILPEATIKKRIELFGKWAGINELTAISLKNSRVIYDLVKLEYETNYGIEINQVELKNLLKENGTKGTIEQLNMSKKILRTKIIKEIINGEDSFIST